MKAEIEIAYGTGDCFRCYRVRLLDEHRVFSEKVVREQDLAEYMKEILG